MNPSNPINPLTAVIIKNVEQLHTGMRAVKALIQDGQRVRVLVLLDNRRASEPIRLDIIKGFVQQGAECFASSPAAAKMPGFRHATVETMAKMLKETDFVVPF